MNKIQLPKIIKIPKKLPINKNLMNEKFGDYNKLEAIDKDLGFYCAGHELSSFFQINIDNIIKTCVNQNEIIEQIKSNENNDDYRISDRSIFGQRFNPWVEIEYKKDFYNNIYNIYDHKSSLYNAIASFWTLLDDFRYQMDGILNYVLERNIMTSTIRDRKPYDAKSAIEKFADEFGCSNLLALPDLVDFHRPWPYRLKWIEENIEGYDKKHEIDQACGVEGAAKKLHDFFKYDSIKYLQRVVAQNNLITHINEGRIEPCYIDDYLLYGSNSNNWPYVFICKETLFDVFNIDSCGNLDIIFAVNFCFDLFERSKIQLDNLVAYIKQEENKRAKFIEYIDASKSLEIKTKNKWQAAIDKNSSVENGRIYVLNNKLMPGVFKIGFTSGEPNKRAAEITRKYSMPSDFMVVESWETKRPYEVEQTVHGLLSKFRISGEFFELDIDIISSTIDNCIIK